MMHCGVYGCVPRCASHAACSGCCTVISCTVQGCERTYHLSIGLRGHVACFEVCVLQAHVAILSLLNPELFIGLQATPPDGQS